MSVELTQNPLRITQGKSNAEQVTLPAAEDGVRAALEWRGMREATAVVWQVNCIRCGIWRDGAFRFADERPLDTALTRELRVFDAVGELHLRREGQELRGRFRADGTGEPAEYVDSMARFWGERRDDGAWMILRDSDRKLELRLPALAQPSRYAGLVTRSYIGIHAATAQAGYVDFRYLAIAAADIKGDE